jgi:hypothetical protein
VPRACRGDPGDRHPTWCSCSLPAARTPCPGRLTSAPSSRPSSLARRVLPRSQASSPGA